MLFGIIGGDRRQEELLALLRRDGYTVAACGVAGEMDWDAAVAAEVVILPLPLCKEGDTLNIEGPRRGAGALFRQLRRDQLILAGQVKPAQAALAAELDLKFVDYFRREELTVANAAATAEGTVQVILERLERSLLGSRCLVLGFVFRSAGMQVSAQTAVAPQPPSGECPWKGPCACVPGSPHAAPHGRRTRHGPAH